MYKICFIAFLLFPHIAGACDIKILAPFARATTPNAFSGVVFMGISNQGKMIDRLMDVETERAEIAQIHNHVMDAETGVMKMREISGGLLLPPGQIVQLKPSGLHIMLMNLKEDLLEKEIFDLELTFAQCGKMTVKIPVKSIGAS